MFNLVGGWLFMAALYVVFMRGYTTADPARTASFEYRREHGDRRGLLPPSHEPVGKLLWALTALAFVAAIVFALVGDRFIGVASGTMVLSFLLTLWRDSRWMKNQPDFQDAVEAARSD